MPSYHKGWIDIHKCILKQKLPIVGPGRDKYNVIFFPLGHELFSTIPFSIGSFAALEDLLNIVL